MGVNLFPAQFQADRLQVDIGECLAKTGLAAEALEIEITENIALAMMKLCSFRCAPCAIAGCSSRSRNFGTGYAR